MIGLQYGVFTLSSYRDRIPNGHRVPNPCSVNADWMGVGHWQPAGSGALNPFGEVS